MNLHLLRIFVAVADHGSFSQAASALYISQPAVSKSVQSLERQLDLPLFDRSGRKLQLTEAGTLVLRHARQIFALERAAEMALDQLRGLETGHLSLGASQTIGTDLLPSILGAFHRRYPGIQLSLEIGNTQQVVELLRHGTLDAAFVEGPVDRAGLVIHPWRNDRMVVIAAPDHPLARQQPVTLAQVLAEPFVVREQGSGTRAVFEQALLERDAQIQIAMELGSNEAVKNAVSAGLGISVISEATVPVSVKAEMLTVLDVSDFDLVRALTRIEVEGRPASPALTAFWPFLAGSDSQPLDG